MATSVEHALEELYAGSPAAFTATRDRLARELRASGDTEGGAAIAARHRPTQLAWVLNQLARRHADLLAELVDVGRELARVQRGALRGGSAAGLREAIARQRTVVAELTGRAAGVMRDLGVDPHGHLDEIAGALHAALVDPAVGEALESGRLEKTPTATAGFPGAAPADPALPPAKRAAQEQRRDAERRKEDRGHAAEEHRAARRRATEERRAAKAHAANERRAAERRAAETASAERAAREEARTRAIAAADERAETAERAAKDAAAAAAAGANEAARAREEAARLAKEARALAREAKRLGVAAKRANALRAKARRTR